MSVRILLVEDHCIVRSGIRMLLESAPELEVVGDVGDGREATEACARLRPDVVLMDIEMASLDGIETARQIHSSMPEVKIIMLSMHDDPKCVFESLKAGASGYVLKGAAFAELLAGIHAVMAGRQFLSPPLADVLSEDCVTPAAGVACPQLDQLSSREREILQLVAEGHSSPQVASIIQIRSQAVDAHRQKLMEKLGIRSIAGLTRFAILNGLTSAPKKNAAAVEMGKLGGAKGGKARAEKLTAERRSEIARRAADALWVKRRPPEGQ